MQQDDMQQHEHKPQEIITDEEVKKILAEVAANDPTKLPEVSVRIYCAMTIAKEWAKLTEAFNHAVEKLMGKFNGK